LRQQHDALGETALAHDFAGEDEERDGHQRVVVDPVDDRLRNDHEIPEAGIDHQADRREDHHQRDRDVQ
jgi:hypothetical protein